MKSLQYRVDVSGLRSPVRHIERDSTRNTVWCGVEPTDWTGKTSLKVCKKCVTAMAAHEAAGLR